MIGIYRIVNRNNSKSYIGQSTNIKLRFSQHIEALKESNASWYPLAREESTGIEDFDFEILQECKQEELDELEEYWINYFDSFHNGYNQTEDGTVKSNIQTVYFKTIKPQDSFMQALNKALKIFTFGELKLYIFLLEKYYEGKEKISLYPSKICLTFNFSLRTYKEAKSKLVKQGILSFNTEKSFSFNPLI